MLVRLIFFIRLVIFGGKCEINGETEELLLVVLSLEDCFGVVIFIFRIFGDYFRDCKGKVFLIGICRFNFE